MGCDTVFRRVNMCRAATLLSDRPYVNNNNPTTNPTHPPRPTSQREVEVKVRSVQLDNHVRNAIFPVILCPRNTAKQVASDTEVRMSFF